MIRRRTGSVTGTVGAGASAVEAAAEDEVEPEAERLAERGTKGKGDGGKDDIGAGRSVSNAVAADDWNER